MKLLHLEPTRYSPAVNFDPDTGKFEISGISLPEDVIAFYSPVLDWLNEFAESLIAGSAGTYPGIQFAFNLNYYNSGSIRFLISVLEVLKRINVYVPVIVQWHYENDDVLLFDNGKELEELSGLKFDFIGIE